MMEGWGRRRALTCDQGHAHARGFALEERHVVDRVAAAVRPVRLGDVEGRLLPTLVEVGRDVDLNAQLSATRPSGLRATSITKSCILGEDGRRRRVRVAKLLSAPTSKASV